MKIYIFILSTLLLLLPQPTSAQSSKELTLGATAFTSYYWFSGQRFDFQSYSIGLAAKYGAHVAYVSPHVISAGPILFYNNMPWGFDIGYQYRFLQEKKTTLPILGMSFSHSWLGQDRSVDPFWGSGKLYIAPNPKNPRLGNTFNLTYLSLMGGFEFFAKKKVSLIVLTGYSRRIPPNKSRGMLFTQLQLNIDLKRLQL